MTSVDEQIGRAPAEASPAVAPVNRQFILWLLLIIYMLNFLDRQVLNILAEPIKHDLKLSDAQLGLLTGLAFALFYTFLGLPIARLAERADRGKIIAVSVAVWSLFTAGCALAQNYVQLLLMRVGVGIGEAGCTPPSHSLISDYFPREERAGALGFYSMGIPLGTMCGLAFGGLVADAHGWRTAMVVAGAPGLVVAAIAFFALKDTRRHLVKAQSAAAAVVPKFGAALREIFSKRSFVWACVGACASALVTYGHSAFYASFFLRNHAEGVAGLTAWLAVTTGVTLGPGGFLGLALGLLLGTSGVVGALTGGKLADYFGRNDARIHVSLPAITTVAGVPFLIVAFLTPNTVVALLLLWPTVFLKSFWLGPILSLAQNVVQPRTRATAAAVMLFLLNLIGLGLGPVALGLISDAMGAQLGVGEGLRWAMAISTLGGLIAGTCYWIARRHIRGDLYEETA